jgi:hypothetical protein
MEESLRKRVKNIPGLARQVNVRVTVLIPADSENRIGE